MSCSRINCKVGLQVGAAGAGQGRHRAAWCQVNGLLGQHLQLRHRQCHHAPWSMARIHQPFDDTQLFDLVQRVAALARRIAPGCRKAVAAFPDAQRVLAQTGVALHRGDGQRDARGRLGGFGQFVHRLSGMAFSSWSLPTNVLDKGWSSSKCEC
jgi:hypothetical protein